MAVYIALGSNLGNKEENLKKALALLPGKGVHPVQVAPFLTTAPYGVTDQPDFLNTVARVETELAPEELLQALLAVEQEMGRVRRRHWGERNIDLDLLLYDDRVLDLPDLKLPHPDMQNRAFVLEPLACIAPDAVHPVLGKTAGTLWAELQQRQLAERMLERFRRYVQVPTASDPDSTAFPSTEKQLVLARALRQELQELGLSGVRLTEYGYVLAELPANTDDEVPVIGLIAHMDTSSEASDTDIDLQVHRNYDGGVLPLGGGRVLDPAVFPELKRYVGQTLLTSDGTTLIGADDKAGLCGIVTACEWFLQHPDVSHGRVLLAFTPDEETGRGTEHFPLDGFPADFAYTVDGGGAGEFNYETFNACNVTVRFHGVSVHPGSAKHKMKNAVTLCAQFQLSLPRGEAPEYTDGREGFYHCMRVQGGVDEVRLDMIVRDHDKAVLAHRKEVLLALAESFNKEYGAGSVELELDDVYSNMKEYILPVYEIVERAEKAFRAAGVEPDIVPVRGGTDGALLSARGLPCPNLFTGGHNFHGPYEYIPLESLVLQARMLVELLKA